ncbi:hypothetical protein NUU61_003158 [Penicillium alfredii]|uniref:Alpha/beta hydrolase fold-3 domain-containing protein n=1 Tax=Penicillium alfredii TaxID=1506179 RepID=A0A9W9KH84_9EURO|nr:uncharacterized protein NUU61_003158 [Penicillium alfredii]KAJ5105811.1 hypothetical protein NUU61_003158 [Penicillium alfredii]
MPVEFDPDFAQAMAPFFAAAAANPQPPTTDPYEIRSRAKPTFEKLMAMLPESPDVERQSFTIESYDGQSITLCRYFKKAADTTTPGPAIVHAHGGGMIFGSTDLFRKAHALQTSQSGVQMFSVDYRLAPEHPYPTPAEDCYAALAWVHSHAADFGIDRQRIATMGESAGGNLAASMTLMARDRGLSPGVAKQILNYPMLNDLNLEPIPALKDRVIWSTEANIGAWSAYLGADFRSDRVSQYAAPARATSVEGLPPTYLDVGSLDIFLNEDLQYVSRIAAANIPVEVHVYPGLPHASEYFTPGSAPTNRVLADRLRAITSL